jgi:hypothetical protein
LATSVQQFTATNKATAGNPSSAVPYPLGQASGASTSGSGWLPCFQRTGPGGCRADDPGPHPVPARMCRTKMKRRRRGYPAAGRPGDSFDAGPTPPCSMIRPAVLVDRFFENYLIIINYPNQNGFLGQNVFWRGVFRITMGRRRHADNHR